MCSQFENGSKFKVEAGFEQTLFDCLEGSHAIPSAIKPAISMQFLLAGASHSLPGDFTGDHSENKRMSHWPFLASDWLDRWVDGLFCTANH